VNPGRNFDIIISGERGAYRLAAVRPDGTRLSDFPLKLEVGDAFQQLLVKRDAATMIAVGECLYNALFTREIYGAFKACQAEGELRIRLSIRPPELAVLPWELMYDPQGREFLVTTHERPLVRTLDTGETPLPMSVEGPLRVLYAAASPADMPRLDLEASRQALERALSEPICQGKVVLDVIEDTTPQMLQERLRQECHILHFDGHGEFKDGAGYLVLCDEYGESHLLRGDLLGSLVEGKSLRLVYLAACETAQAAESDPLAGVA
jgi:hypothetical protein